ncbi:hypothetical protein Tco_0531849 [Tanacetum coccineum]
MAAVEVPQTLEYKGGQLNAALVLEVENFTNWKKRFMCHIIVKAAWLGFWPTIGDGEFILWGTSVKKIRDPKGVGYRDVICGGMFLNRLARSYRLLTNAMVDAFSVEPRAPTFMKKSLVTMEIIIELDGGICCWPTAGRVGEDDEVEEEAKGSTETYQSISRGDWQYLSTRDNLDPHLQIDPFPGREEDYPPYGYIGYMPSGYDYRFGTAPDGSS